MFFSFLFFFWLSTVNAANEMTRWKANCGYNALAGPFYPYQLVVGSSYMHTYTYTYSCVQSQWLLRRGYQFSGQATEIQVKIHLKYFIKLIVGLLAGWRSQIFWSFAWILHFRFLRCSTVRYSFCKPTLIQLVGISRDFGVFVACNNH